MLKFGRVHGLLCGGLLGQVQRRSQDLGSHPPRRPDAKTSYVGPPREHTAKAAMFSAQQQGWNAIQGFGPISGGIAVAARFCFAAPQAEALELYAPGPATGRWCSFGSAGGRGGGGCTVAAACMAK